MAECFLERLCFHGNSSFLYIRYVLYHALLILDFLIGKESSIINFLLSRFLHQPSKWFLEVAVYKFKKTVKIWLIDFLGFYAVIMGNISAMYYGRTKFGMGVGKIFEWEWVGDSWSLLFHNTCWTKFAENIPWPPWSLPPPPPSPFFPPHPP